MDYLVLLGRCVFSQLACQLLLNQQSGRQECTGGEREGMHMPEAYAAQLVEQLCIYMLVDSWSVVSHLVGDQ